MYIFTVYSAESIEKYTTPFSNIVCRNPAIWDIKIAVADNGVRPDIPKRFKDNIVSVSLVTRTWHYSYAKVQMSYVFSEMFTQCLMIQ